MSNDSNLFVEQRMQGDYAVRRPNSERASIVAPTQYEAIAWANRHVGRGNVFIERVRNTTLGHPDKWRTE